MIPYITNKETKYLTIQDVIKAECPYSTLFDKNVIISCISSDKMFNFNDFSLNSFTKLL